MCETITLGDIHIEVVKKNIKNINLRVSSSGSVSISAPLRIDRDTIHAFARSKLNWINRQQQKFRSREQYTPPTYIDDEQHAVWGKRYMLNVVEQDSVPDVRLEHDIMLLSVRPGSGKDTRRAVVEAWYRKQLERAVSLLYDTWQPVIGVIVEKFSLRRMKTRWGSCSPRTRRIRLNTELAKKPPECLEYVIVHEMVHILEPSHNHRFHQLMGSFMPEWQKRRSLLKK